MDPTILILTKFTLPISLFIIADTIRPYINRRKKNTEQKHNKPNNSRSNINLTILILTEYTLFILILKLTNVATFLTFKIIMQ